MHAARAAGCKPLPAVALCVGVAHKCFPLLGKWCTVALHSHGCSIVCNTINNCLFAGCAAGAPCTVDRLWQSGTGADEDKAKRLTTYRAGCIHRAFFSPLSVYKVCTKGRPHVMDSTYGLTCIAYVQDAFP